MENKHIIAICVVLSIVGIVALYFLTSTQTSSAIPISEAKERVGEAVSIEGTIQDLRSREGNIFFTLSDESDDIFVAYFKAKEKLVNGDRIIATGKISEYKGQMELVLNSFKKT